MNQLTNKLHIADMLGNRYQIISIIGRGGMGTVYLAEDLKLKGKKWAVKETKYKHASAEQFIAEAEMLTKLSHPYLPQIVDYFPPDAEGYSYVVMDYVRGETLSKRFERGGKKLAVSLVIKYAMQICDLFYYLHHEQTVPIIYRDLKPSNIMIDENDNVRIIDFGIARNFKEGQQTDTVQLGTIGFAAPEQFENRQTDQRTDLYALGAVMYYLLSGGQYFYAHQKELAEFNRDLPDELVRIIHKLLQVNPSDRYPDVMELRGDLKTLDVSLIRSDMQQPSQPVKANAIGSVVVAVTGVAPCVGSTHTAIMMAHYLSAKKYSVALVEANASSDYEKIECVYEGLDYGQLETTKFTIRGVDYMKSNSSPSMVELLSLGYDYIVLDLGYYQNSEFYGEFLRAHIPIAVGAGSEWKQPDIVQFYNSQPNADYSRWALCVPFAGKQVVQDIQRQVPKLRIRALPFCPDPFAVREELEEAMKELLPVASSSSGSLLKKWFGRR